MPALSHAPHELTQVTLDNGLHVVVQEDHASPLAAVNVWYRVGARDEEAGRTGFAHLFEHVMFQGSTNVPKGGHFGLLESVGAELNATTSNDRTNYFETVPAHELELAMWLEGDRMGGLDVNQENLDNQRDVVKEEKRQRYDNQPAGTLFPRLLAALFPAGHPYHHAAIGSMEDLDAASLEDVTRFHATYYTPGNAVLTVVGDVETNAVIDLANRYFGAIPAGATPPTPRRGTIDLRLTEDIRHRIADTVALPQVVLGWRLPPEGAPGSIASEVAFAVLGAGRGSELFRELATERELISPSAILTQPLGLVGDVSLGLGRFEARAGVTVEAVEDAVMAVIERVAADGVSDEMLERATTLAASSWLGELSSIASRANEFGHFATWRGDATAVDDHLHELQAVTAADVDTIIRDILTGGRAVLVFEPGSDDSEVTA